MIENIEKSDIIKTIDSIKQDIINTRNKIMYNANRELINMYFRMGKNISHSVKYGSNFVTTLSKSLKLEFPNSNGFSERNLWRMKAFYEQYKDFSILPPAVAELPWTHNYILLEKIKDRDKRLWYANECLKNGWSKSILIHQIELELYERQILANKFTNFNKKIKFKKNSDLATEIIKDPYIFELEGLKKNYGGNRYLPYAFTEHGIIMLSGLLNSNIAINTSIKIIRAFVQMRKYISSNLVNQTYYNNMTVRHDNEIKIW